MQCLCQAYLFFGLFMSIPIALSILFSARLCYQNEKESSLRMRVFTFILAILGLYPQYWACRSPIKSYFMDQIVSEVHIPISQDNPAWLSTSAWQLGGC